MIVLLIVLAVLIVLALLCIRIVNTGYEMVVETLGKYSATWGAGIHVKIPFVQSIVNRVSLKERVADFPPQSVITKDNVMITSDSVVYFKIMDAKL